MTRKIATLMVLSMFAALLLAPAPAAADVQWGVHLASYRTKTKARLGWQQLLAGHHDLLASEKCIYTPVTIPGQGEYLRIIVGPLQSREQAMKLERDLRARGAYADTMPCPEDASVVSLAGSDDVSQPRQASAAQAFAQPQAPAVAAPRAPAAPQVQAPAAPSLHIRNHTAARKASSQSKGEGLRKYVPAPVVDSVKSLLEPLSSHEQKSRESLPGIPQQPSSGITGKSHRIGFKSGQSTLDGVTLATAPGNTSRISAQYGNMEEDFETTNKISPLSPGDNSYNFKPYLGLGFHF